VTVDGSNTASAPSGSALGVSALAALGVVFGDLGTSPLYALHDTFVGSRAIAANHDNVLGVLSLFVWSLIVIVGVKYVTVMMRADNRGEGGIFALLALTGAMRATGSRVLFLGIAGAALLHGDGVITPAISVLSAVEGLTVATCGRSIPATHLRSLRRMGGVDFPCLVASYSA
jgi:KUP system potassium uptake protein